jgi:hypothetical protein
VLFASYSRADRDQIRTLLTDLHALGHVVWLDEELSGGQVWWDEILAKIRQCDAFMFLITPASVESEACLLELEYAVALDRVVIPVHVAQTDPAALPSILETHQTVSYRQGDKSEMMALARALTQTEVGRPLPDPLPAVPPLPGSYLGSIRDQIRSQNPLNLDQQLGLLHRLRLRADDGAGDDVVGLLESFRTRDDLFASVAEEIDALHRSLAAPVLSGERRDSRFGNLFRRPTALIDRVTITLVAVAIVAAVVAWTGVLWKVDGGTYDWGNPGVGSQRWHLGVLLALFVALAVLSYSKVRVVQTLASAAALSLSLVGLLVWWWQRAIVGGLLLKEYIDNSAGPITLGLGLTGSGFSLALQVLAGLLLCISAFSRGADKT